MNSLNQTDFFPVSVINKNSSVVGKRPLSHIKWKVILYSIKTDDQSIISIKAINQLSEREIDECLLDWSTSLMACNHSKNYACVCVSMGSMCSSALVWLSLHGCVDCMLVIPDTSFQYRFYRHVPTCSGPTHIKTYCLCLCLYGGNNGQAHVSWG